MRIHLYSLHGLFRGEHLEIGRDADNGGQIIYVMELAKTLAEMPEVEHVHLFTRRIEDPELDPIYAQSIETLTDKLDIRRISFGGKRYLPKEQLWPHLDAFVSGAINHIKEHRIFPDWIHSHYADAGYAAVELSSFLNVPMAHTGHSLGLPKRNKLREAGLEDPEIERLYQMNARIAAEESALACAEFIVTSSQYEIGDYSIYANASRNEYHVIPPGINHNRFFPYYHDAMEGARPDEVRLLARHSAREHLDKFFTHPDRPIILAICRPDRKKNIDGLIHAYGTDPALQAMANLAIFAGIRSDISRMPEGEKLVLTEILLLMDKYNLYGKLAIPKKHDSAWEVPELYRLCAWAKGVFVNVALTEPFGLTVLEAGACALPVVATDSGGPVEILGRTECGLLAAASDTASIQSALHKLLTDRELWENCSRHGSAKIREIYDWSAHTTSYLKLVEENLQSSQGQGRKNIVLNPRIHQRLKDAKRIFVSDIDGTILDETGDRSGLDALRKFLEERPADMAFAVASGRTLQSIRSVFEEYQLPWPDLAITSVGTQIYYAGDEKHLDKSWSGHIGFRWNREQVLAACMRAPGLELQEFSCQNPHKISFYSKPDAFSMATLERALGKLRLHVNCIHTQNAFLDILPRRASKGRAIRHACNKWNIPLRGAVVAGDSGNDLDMLTGTAHGIVVGNYAPELEVLRVNKRVYFSSHNAAQGILDGLQNLGILVSKN